MQKADFRKILLGLSFLLFLGVVFASSVTFNVYQESGIDYNLTGINVDCNSGATYDLTNQSSPFTINFASGSYSCIFSKTEWDSNTITLVADVNKTIIVYLDKFVYPKIIAFTNSTATTSSTSATPVQTWSYDANFGGTTNMTIGCSFWATSGATAFTGTWNIQSSDNGTTWTTRGTINRTMSSNTAAGSVYLAGTAYNITDGTRYVRLTHQTSSALGSLTTNAVSCHLRTNRDQNNFLMTTAVDSRAETTINSSTFTNLGAAFNLVAPYNGFLYFVGSTTYRKTNANTTSESSFRLLKNSSSLTEYPRYVTNNSSGVGGLAEFFSDANSGQTITSQYQGRSVLSQTRFSFNIQKYFLNQEAGEYEQRALTMMDNNSRDWNQIACATFSHPHTRDIEVVAVIPHKSNLANDLFQIYFNAKGSIASGYDVNSLIAGRSFSGADQNGIMVHQYLFRDVNSNDVNICIYGKSTLGKITITGGNVVGITANATTQSISVVDTNSSIVIHDLNFYQTGVLNQNVDLTIYSDVNVLFDFNAIGDAVDINSARVFYRAPYDDQNCFGLIRATKQCTWKEEDSNTFFTGSLVDTNNYYFLSMDDDDHVFKPWVYNADPDFFEAKDGNFELYTSDRWIKSLHTLVPTGPNYFYNFSFSATPPTGAHDLEFYDCNNDASDPTTDNGCFLVDFAYNTPKDPDTFYSIKYNANDQNQIVSNNLVSLNSDGNHWVYMRCPSCTVSDNWKIDYVSTNTNIDRIRNWTTTVGTSLFSATTNTHNVHYHYLIPDQNNYTEWYVTLNNLAGTTFTSEIYREQIATANLPPIPGGFNSPLSGNYYKGTVDINWNVYDPNNDPLLCDFNITKTEEGNLVYSTTNISATNNNTLCLVSGIPISYLASGTYSLRGVAREYDNDYNYSGSSNETFGIDNNYPMTNYTGCNNLWNNSSQTITLSCTDTNGVGCNQTQYSTNLGAWNTYSTSFSINLDGNNRVDYNSNDSVGNIEPSKILFCAIDNNAPRVSAPSLIDYNSLYDSGSQLYIKGPISISTDVNDLITGISVSDINSTSCEYSLDGGANWFSADYNNSALKCEKNNVTLTNGQNYIFRFRVRDNSTNLGTGASSSSYIADSNAPITADNAPNGAVSGNILVTLNSTDALSGLDKIYYCEDETDVCNPFAGIFTDNNSISIDVNCGGPATCTKYIRYYAIDNIGNTENPKSSGAINFDNSVPLVGPTDINGFLVHGNHIKGTGNILGGIVDDFDFNSLTSAYTIDGNNYTLCSEDTNCFFTDSNQLIKLGITAVDGETYIFNTRIGHEADTNFGFGTPTITYLGDYTNPVSSDNYDGLWHDLNVTVTISATDLVGVQNTYYCTDDTNTCTPTTIGTIATIGCGEGQVCQNYLRYYSVDFLDNNEFGLGGAKSTLVKIDKNKPNTTINFSNTNWVQTFPTITFTCNDYSASGCASKQYKLDNNSIWTTSNSVTISTDGNHLLEYRSIDNVGNTEDTKSIYVAVDSTPPTFLVDNNNFWFNSPFSLLFTDTNFEVSGKDSAQAQINSGGWIDLNNTSNTYYTGITQDGNNTVDYNFVDNSTGYNQGTTFALLDTVLPLTSVSGCTSGWNTTPRIITLSCSDSTSGCAHTYRRINTGSWVDSNTLSISTDGNHKIEYYSVDTAGNIEIQKTFYCALDQNAPIIDSILNTDTYFTHDFNVVFKQVTFGSSGFGSAKYRLNAGAWQNMIAADNNDYHVLIATDGNNSLDYNIINLAGNYVSGTVYALLQREDTDEDGNLNINDPLFFTENEVTNTGLANTLNILVGGLPTTDLFSGVKDLNFYDGTNPIMNFDFNFDANTFDLSEVTITKTSNSILVDLNSQLQIDYNKTLYLVNNNFISLCVKDAQISAISEISSSCIGANEYDFSSCLTNGTYSAAGINCTLTNGLIKVENLRNSGMLGVPYSSTSGGCSPNWSCTSWSTCINGTQTRTCTETNCNTTAGKPIEQQTCNLTQVTDNNVVVIDTNKTVIINQPDLNKNDSNKISQTDGNTLIENEAGEENYEFGFGIPLLVIAFVLLFLILKKKKKKEDLR